MSNRIPSVALTMLLRDARLEVLPADSVLEQIQEHVEPGRAITVTSSPAKGIEATLALVERLAGSYQVVPHLGARMIHGRDELTEIVARLQEAGVTQVFVPGGDAAATDATYSCSLELLADLRELGSPFAEVGITGYPESHPGIDDDVVVQSMWDKRELATNIVSNLTFDDAKLNRWLERVRRRGVGLPVHVGVPGPVDTARLLRMATTIGVGDSARFLRKQKGVLARLVMPGFSPTRFVQRVAALAATERLGIAGLHIYTFNQVAESERWRQGQLAETTRSMT